MTFVPQDDYPKDIECPLCLESFDSPVEARPCKHVFCFACLTKLGRHAVCPLCRKGIATHAAAPKPLRKQAALIQGHCDGSLLLRRGSKTSVASPNAKMSCPPGDSPPLAAGARSGVYGQISDHLHFKAVPVPSPGKPTQSEGEICPCDWSGTRADFAQHLDQVQHHVEQRDTALSDLQAAKDAEDEEASERFQNILGALLGGMVVESPDEAFALIDHFAENRRSRVDGWGESFAQDMQLAMAHPQVQQFQLRSHIAHMSDNLHIIPDDDDDDNPEFLAYLGVRYYPAQLDTQPDTQLRQHTQHRGQFNTHHGGQQGYQPAFVQQQMNPALVPRTAGGPQTFGWPLHHSWAPHHVNRQGPPSQPNSIRRHDPYAQLQPSSIRRHDPYAQLRPVPQYPIRQPQQHVRSQPPPSYHSQQHQQWPWNHQWGTQPPPPQQGALPAPYGAQSGQYGPAGAPVAPAQQQQPDAAADWLQSALSAGADSGTGEPEMSWLRGVIDED